MQLLGTGRYDVADYFSVELTKDGRTAVVTAVGRRFFARTRDLGDVVTFGIDTGSGRLRWQLPGGATFCSERARLVDDTLLICHIEGQLRTRGYRESCVDARARLDLVDAATGAVRRRIDLGSRTTTSPPTEDFCIPDVAHLQGDTYRVLYNDTSRRFRLGDPAVVEEPVDTTHWFVRSTERALLYEDRWTGGVYDTVDPMLEHSDAMPPLPDWVGVRAGQLRIVVRDRDVVALR